MIELSDDTFKEFVASGTVLVDFYTRTCPPCRAFVPTLQKVEPDYPNIAFGKLDASEHYETTKGFNISGVPTLIAFKDGTEVARSIGLVSEGKLREFLNSVEA